MDSNSQYPYEDNPEGRRPEPLPTTPGASEAHRRRLLLQSGMTPDEVDRVMASPRSAREQVAATMNAAQQRRRLGTARPDADMEAWVERFAAALAADAIHPIDF